MRLPETLDPVQVRVLGALLEKEQATPDYYPLTLNALLAACNQRSNREPVMALGADEVRDALHRLHEDVLVWPVSGSRSERWRHNLDRRWELDPPTKAIVTLLLLRGAQTPGELRARSERLHPFATTDEVQRSLYELARGDEPLAVQLERRPGQKESRWMHLVCGAPEEGVEATPVAPAAAAPSGVTRRIAELEQRVERLEEEMQQLRTFLE